MIVLWFFILSLVLAISILIIKNKLFYAFAGTTYIILQIALTFYAHQNNNDIDSVYFKFDSLSILLNGFLAFILIPIIFHSKLYLKRHVPVLKMKGRFLSLIIILTAALSGVYFTDNFVIMWVCLEITTIVVTFLIFHERYNDALEASWKYLFVSSVGITIAFLGLLFLSVQSKEGSEVTLSYNNLLNIADNLDPFFLKTAFLLLITGYSIKMNLFPLYAATVDAKTVAPFPVNAITSTAMVNAGFVAIFRIYSIISKTNSIHWAQNVLLIVGVISIVIATIQLFRIKRFKRMFAFSTMEHSALIVIALSLGKVGYYAALLHLLLHTLAKTGMFLHFGIIRAGFQSGWLKDTGNYMKNNGVAAIVYIVGLLTVTAVPPSGMFVSEFLIFKALFSTNNYFLAILIFFLLTIVMFILFRNSMQLLYGTPSENYKPQNAIVNKFEPISQLVLFGLVFYFAYFPPLFFTELMNEALKVLN